MFSSPVEESHDHVSPNQHPRTPSSSDRLAPFAWRELSVVLEMTWSGVVRDEVERARGGALGPGQRAAAKLEVGVVLGRPADALLALSERVDLLVIGSRRWGPTARLLLGSTGEALMHDAACPVLAVPRPPR